MKQTLLLALGAAVIFCALVLPNHPGTMKWSALNRWPLELPVILLALAVLGHRIWAPLSIALVLTLAVAVKLADYIMFSAYNRTFDPIVDLYLIGPAFVLLAETIGHGQAALAFAFGAIALVAIFAALFWAAQTWARTGLARPTRFAAGVLAVCAAGWATADAGHHLEAWRFESSPPGTAWTSRLMVKRGISVSAATADLVTFRQTANKDPFADREDLLNALNGRDVILIWIESYGRASFDNPLYTERHGHTLRAAEDRLASVGFEMRSGWLTAPTAGGQSWLSHATLATGLWASDQARYAALIASGKPWLFHIAQEAGYRTAAIMPAISQSWPESAAMGFDTILAAADMKYEGDRFRWVTMPDQFTLAAYQGLLAPDPRPDFLQIALISSHAPFTPIPDVVDWEAIGNGTIFNPMAARGPAPKDLWANRDDVRAAYALSVDYALRVTFSHVARLADAAPLVIVAGDHQSAPWIAGSDSREVAVHMIGPPDVIAHLASWGWTPGLIPDANGPIRGMDSFRDDFIDAFTRSKQEVGWHR